MHDGSFKGITSEIAELQDRKSQYATQKRDIERELTSLKNKIKYGPRTSKKKYFKLVNKRESYIRKMASVEEEIVSIKHKIHELHNERAAIAANKMDEIDNSINDYVSETILIENIQRLRSKYLEFAKDFTRVNSMRLMASTFVKELEELMK